MTIREGTAADLPAVRDIFATYFGELWQRPWPAAPPTDDWLGGKLLLLAEDEGALIGGLVAAIIPGAVGHVHLVYVRPEHRRQGVARALLRETADRFRAAGAEHVTLSVDVSNGAALEIWRRLGFTDFALKLEAPLQTLEGRLADREAVGPSFASIHVQTDDVSAVERAVRRYVPRAPSAGTAISQPHNGWIAAYDDLCDHDPDALKRLARQVSVVTATVTLALSLEQGAVVRYVLLERGSVVDEYLSLPEHYGPLPPGDVVALGANPTAVARLTGADPARLRRVARTAKTADELPPAEELLSELADALGLEGATFGYAGASGQPGMTLVEHG
jgi:GNAT superfamily N-acetyltransferase